MKAYTIRVALRGVSPMIWRRFSIAADMSLACLHCIIQIAQGWNDEYLHQFHIYGKDHGISYEGGISISDGPYQAVLDDFGVNAPPGLAITHISHERVRNRAGYPLDDGFPAISQCFQGEDRLNVLSSRLILPV